jgi:hypothetical protein
VLHNGVLQRRFLRVPGCDEGIGCDRFHGRSAFPCARRDSRGSAPVARTHAVADLFPHNSSTVSATKRSFAF